MINNVTTDHHATCAIPGAYNDLIHGRIIVEKFGFANLDAVASAAVLDWKQYTEIDEKALRLTFSEDVEEVITAKLVRAEIRQRAFDDIRYFLGNSKEDISSQKNMSIDELFLDSVISRWPELTTAMLISDMESSDPAIAFTAISRATSIDHQTDFLALHLRSILGGLESPRLKDKALTLMLKMCEVYHGSIDQKSPVLHVERNLAAAICAGDVSIEHIKSVFDRLTDRTQYKRAVEEDIISSITKLVDGYRQVSSSISSQPSFLKLRAKKALAELEKKHEIFLHETDGAYARSLVCEILEDRERLAFTLRKLIHSAYIDTAKSDLDRHRAEERLMLLSEGAGQSLTTNPQTVLQRWLVPYGLGHFERELLLDTLVLETLHSGKAISEILAAGVLEPVYRDQALSLLIEVAWISPEKSCKNILRKLLKSRLLYTDLNIDQTYEEFKKFAALVIGSTAADTFVESIKSDSFENVPQLFAIASGAQEESENFLDKLTPWKVNHVEIATSFIKHIGGEIHPQSIKSLKRIMQKNDEELLTYAQRFEYVIDRDYLKNLYDNPKQRTLFRQFIADLILLADSVGRIECPIQRDFYEKNLELLLKCHHDDTISIAFFSNAARRGEELSLYTTHKMSVLSLENCLRPGQRPPIMRLTNQGDPQNSSDTSKLLLNELKIYVAKNFHPYYIEAVLSEWRYKTNSTTKSKLNDFWSDAILSLSQSAEAQYNLLRGISLTVPLMDSVPSEEKLSYERTLIVKIESSLDAFWWLRQYQRAAIELQGNISHASIQKLRELLHANLSNQVGYYAALALKTRLRTEDSMAIVDILEKDSILLASNYEEILKDQNDIAVTRRLLRLGANTSITLKSRLHSVDALIGHTSSEAISFVLHQVFKTQLICIKDISERLDLYGPAICEMFPLLKPEEQAFAILILNSEFSSNKWRDIGLALNNQNSFSDKSK